MVCCSAWGQGANIDLSEYFNGAKNENSNPRHDILSCNLTIKAFSTLINSPIFPLAICSFVHCLIGTWVDMDLLGSALNTHCSFNFSL